MSANLHALRHLEIGVGIYVHELVNTVDCKKAGDRLSDHLMETPSGRSRWSWSLLFFSNSIQTIMKILNDRNQLNGNDSQGIRGIYYIPQCTCLGYPRIHCSFHSRCNQWILEYLSNHLFIKYSWNLSVWAILSFFGIHAGPKIYWAMIFFKTPSKTMLMDPGLNWEVWLWKDRDVITHVIINGREWIRANWLIFLDIKLLSFGSQAWNGMQHHNFVLHLKRNINFFHYKWISCTGSDF